MRVDRTRHNAAGRTGARAPPAEGGDADLVFTLDPTGRARRASVPDVDVTSVAIPRVVALKPDVGHPFLQDLQDPRARGAIDLILDRAGIAAGILRARGGGEPALPAGALDLA